MEEPTRRTSLTVTYNSASITSDLAPMIIGFEYVDVVDGKHADSVSLTVTNKDRQWYGEWLPDRGATLTATLTCRDWPGGKVLECGKFEIDGINFADEPSTCTITALAAGVTSSLRRERVTKAWKDISVREIATEVAKKHRFELVFDVDKAPPKQERYDQREQSDIEMLVELADRYGLVVRISDKTIVIQEGLKQDKQAPSHTFDRTGGEVLRNPFFRIDSSEIYTACKVQYFDPESRLPIAYTHKPGASEWSGEKPPSGYVLKINRRCQDQAEAEVMAKAALREANKREVTGTIPNLGNPDIRAGTTALIKGWGKLDSAPYFVETVRHRVDKRGGYTTTAEIRGVIDY